MGTMNPGGFGKRLVKFEVVERVKRIVVDKGGNRTLVGQETRLMMYHFAK